MGRIGAAAVLAVVVVAGVPANNDPRWTEDYWPREHQINTESCEEGEARTARDARNLTALCDQFPASTVLWAQADGPVLRLFVAESVATHLNNHRIYTQLIVHNLMARWKEITGYDEVTVQMGMLGWNITHMRDNYIGNAFFPFMLPGNVLDPVIFAIGKTTDKGDRLFMAQLSPHLQSQMGRNTDLR